MEENSFNFKEKVKLSFKRAKEDISILKKELNENKELILIQTQKIDFLTKKIKELSSKLLENQENKAKKNKSSIGNEGVYSFIHSFNNYSTIKHSDELHKFRKNLEEDFMSLSKQEFLTFLTIYQLEEDIGVVSYYSIAKHLKLSEGCIRTYVSSLIHKGIPIIKEKINNRFVTLKISKDFRNLNLKNKLLDLYNQVDPYQKKLFDGF
jgi:beta-galactosidase beta subunit